MTLRCANCKMESDHLYARSWLAPKLCVTCWADIHYPEPLPPAHPLTAQAAATR